MSAFSPEHVRAILSALFYGGDKSCPSCGGDGWKMSAPPICARCGFTPFPKGRYRALAKEAAARIEATLEKAG